MGPTYTQQEAVNDQVSIVYLCGHVISLPRHNTYKRERSVSESVVPHVQGCILFNVTGQGYANGTKNKIMILVQF